MIWTPIDDSWRTFWRSLIEDAAMIRIVGGKAKGHSLFVAPGIRPTSVMLRRKLFDSRICWKSALFVDICAGSGAVGFEAWSRGAKSVVLVECDRKVFGVLKKNRRLLGERFPYDIEAVELERSSVEAWLPLCPMGREAVVYLDPPYNFSRLYATVLHKLGQLGFQGTLWIETGKFHGVQRKDILHHFWIEKDYRHADGILYRTSLKIPGGSLR